MDPGYIETLYSFYVGESCAAEAADLATIAHCYSIFWEYYSINEYIPLDQHPSSRDSPTSSTPSGSHESQTGAIVGGVIGSVAAVAAIIGALILYLRRRRRLALERQAQQINEVKHELTSGAMPSEMPDRRSPVEMPNERPPVEIEGNE